VSTSLVSALSASETKPTTKQGTTIQESHICIAPGHSKNLQKYHRSFFLSCSRFVSVSLSPVSLLQHKAKEKKPEQDKQNKQSNKQTRKKKQQNPKMSTNQSHPSHLPTYNNNFQ
jgi:hypothetical protein